MKQATFSMTGYFDKGKRTKREQLLAEMDQVMPWVRLRALIEPHYPKASKVGGRPSIPMERMLRIHCLEQWYTCTWRNAIEWRRGSETKRGNAVAKRSDQVQPVR